jgi:hypothetical protein
VRMRSRKPWVFARRRLFGWKVRLLTSGSVMSLGIGEETDRLQPGLSIQGNRRPGHGRIRVRALKYTVNDHQRHPPPHTSTTVLVVDNC